MKERLWKTTLMIGLMSLMPQIAQTAEILDLDIIPYEQLISEESESVELLRRALHEKGIVGIKGVPGYKERVTHFIETARAFSALPEEIKESYAPGPGEIFLGYERGKEKFKRPDGKWVVDDLKVSYYAYVPEDAQNKWPTEVDLQTPFMALTHVMADMGEFVLEKLGLIGQENLTLEGAFKVGRMLYYRKASEGAHDNPYWCGAHFDHSLFTALLPAFYYTNDELIAEPEEAGLFVRASRDPDFKKVMASDPDVMLFQVGEFGQLVSNDSIRATEHRVHKAQGAIERYTLALFFDAPLDYVVHSTSELTRDSRYGGQAGDPCSYQRWHEESFKRYIVQDETDN